MIWNLQLSDEDIPSYDSILGLLYCQADVFSASYVTCDKIFNRWLQMIYLQKADYESTGPPCKI